VQELTANCQQLTSEQANKEEIITNQQEKISRLEAALTKPKKNQGTQTIIDYEAIIENEKKKNQELTNKLATSNELLRKLAEREREQNQRTDSNSDYESAEE
jgi:long-subunit fatty acid transport protein